jgi:DNA repair protein RadD
MINPRYYQQESHDSVIHWVKSTAESCVIELPTGAGKSVVVAMIANTLNQISKGKHVLCIVPKKELVEQNAEKLILVGGQCSMFSASVGETCLKHPLVVGTPVSIKNQLHRFGSKFCAVIIDECHQITPTVKTIIESLREHNPNLRVIGLSATPYRLGQGFVYGIDTNGKMLDDTQAKEPYFKRLVYRLDARELIEQGFLSNPVIGATNAHYDTSGLTQNRMGNFDSATVDKAFIGKGRLTSSIVADVVEKSQGRKGVMIFAATIQHANEVMESLPRGLSQIVTGETPKQERELILSQFKSNKLKYLVNVAVLTTGFDAPNCDTIAILRATESVALLQQIIGRGLRICEGKSDCLVLDYAENIERHCPDGDVFNPEIKASGGGEVGVPVNAKCPSCNGVNEFSKRRDVDAEQPIDDNGYLLDLEGNRIEVEGLGAMPAHYGRRCTFTVVARGVIDRCSYRWTFKECEECNHENDIAARRCANCKTELIDPNDKLKLEHAQIKDATVLQTEECLDVNVTPTLSKAGNECLRVKFTTPTRVFTVWFNKSTPKQTALQIEFELAQNLSIKTVTYQKDKTGFFKVYSYNKDVLV